jgi:hypothetical protein
MWDYFYHPTLNQDLKESFLTSDKHKYIKYCTTENGTGQLNPIRDNEWKKLYMVLLNWYETVLDYSVNTIRVLLVDLKWKPIWKPKSKSYKVTGHQSIKYKLQKWSHSSRTDIAIFNAGVVRKMLITCNFSWTLPKKKVYSHKSCKKRFLPFLFVSWFCSSGRQNKSATDTDSKEHCHTSSCYYYSI